MAFCLSFGLSLRFSSRQVDWYRFLLPSGPHTLSAPIDFSVFNEPSWRMAGLDSNGSRRCLGWHVVVLSRGRDGGEGVGLGDNDTAEGIGGHLKKKARPRLPPPPPPHAKTRPWCGLR